MTGRKFGRHFAVAAVAVTTVAGSLLYPGQVSAQETPTASASSACDPEGLILVEIVDDFSTTYDVVIDGELVDGGVTDSDGDVYAYGPFDDGTYNVVVTWLETDEDILDTSVTVDCTSDETTTTTTTTTVAPATPPAVAPQALEAPAPIRFTG